MFLFTQMTPHCLREGVYGHQGYCGAVFHPEGVTVQPIGRRQVTTGTFIQGYELRTHSGVTIHPVAGCMYLFHLLLGCILTPKGAQ